MQSRQRIAAILMAVSPACFATNGMNMEGYGPIASGMGGASFAYDNGTAATMNNPATLALAADGSRLDVALGFLGPRVRTSMPGMGSQKSRGNAYYMPAIGWIRNDGDFAYGLGLFAQGGMGTEYKMGMDGLKERSELGVGRFIVPLAWQATPDFTIGGSIDVVWAMLDLRMAMPLGDGTYGMSSLITKPPTGNIGMALGGLDPTDIARLDFSDGNDFTGKSKGYGLAGKIGFTYKASPTVTLGGTYHSKTRLRDLKTSSSGADFIVNGDTANAMEGKIKVRNFQWPAIYGLGVAVQATPDLMIAADIKRIGWKSVMRNFTMTYSAMGDSVTFSLPQNWKNQTVFQFGASYRATEALTLRAGANLSKNPIPDSTMNYLFPAIVKNHYTMGLGYVFNERSELNFSLQHAPKVSQRNSVFGFKTSHSQTSWQVMYTHRY